ncbi:unnamed protein product [Didymodactylos carnosus]|uniref:Uncharacterized protein n=1 Tax=Didymodactylos carnosus TaxID=1234261 RepID=A0A814KKG5_9BILA|nr:unnamed protein product [Didymodactylos carnosus]CAF1053770.1 unnamed protein product [Didymodactylos carnosus]CAF3550822.1 unnamed protein product [Didymodactylos carnosus]CAF3823015.1 unnamed protein product [Didymodactylos carnosus]
MALQISRDQPCSIDFLPTSLQLKRSKVQSISEPTQNIQSLVALSFLPTSDVISAFEQLKQQLPAQEAIINYYEETYVGIKSRFSRPRKQPKFELDL